MKNKEKKITVKLSRKKGVMGGSWCLFETRIPLVVVLDMLEKGWSVKELTEEHWPWLKGKGLIK